MYGYALTKLGGMGHVYHYYLGGYREMTAEEARHAPALLDVDALSPLARARRVHLRAGGGHGEEHGGNQYPDGNSPLLLHRAAV